MSLGSKTEFLSKFVSSSIVISLSSVSAKCPAVIRNKVTIALG